jgi:hypothetical protein
VTQHRGLRRWFRTTSAALGTGFLIAVVSVGLAACGYDGSDQGSISSTQSPAQVIDSQPQATPFPGTGAEVWRRAGPGKS